MARRDTTHRPNPAAVALGVLWVVGGVILVAAGLMRLVPSLYALGAVALLAGALGLVAAFVPTTTLSFWTELVPGALLLAFGMAVVRFPTLEVPTVQLLAAVVLLALGLVRLGAAREFLAAWRPLLFAGLVSLFLGLVLLTDVVPASLAGVAFLLGCDLLVGGIVVVRTAGR